MLKDISETLLCELPEKTPWTVDEFMQKMEVFLFILFLNKYLAERKLINEKIAKFNLNNISIGTPKFLKINTFTT